MSELVLNFSGNRVNQALGGIDSDPFHSELSSLSLLRVFLQCCLVQIHGIKEASNLAWRCTL